MKSPQQIFSVFDNFPQLFVAVSEKKYGGMKIRYELPKDEKTLINREKFLKQYGVTNAEVITALLIHRDTITSVSKNEAGQVIGETDALITNDRGIFLAITTADCLPIFMYDPKTDAIALIHAGWKGLAAGIIGKSIKHLGKNYTSKAENVIAGIGAGIGVCHFEVKQDVADKFAHYQGGLQKRNGKIFADLKQIAFEQLVSNGIKQENIGINRDCTYHEKEKYFSYRRRGSLPLKAHLAIMGLRKS